jgi:hypothetical protein
MQLKSDVTRFLNNAENTMNAELSASVGLALLQLAHYFSDYPLKNESNLLNLRISEKQINTYLEALSKKVAKQNDAVQTAWQFIQAKINEKPNHLDMVTLWINNEETKLCIDLKTTLALVYAALTDKNAFWEDALRKKSLTNGKRKEKITYRESFEETYKIEKAERLLTLWNCFITLQGNSRCHQGIRHEFAMTLNGVYPGLWFIEDFEIFLKSLMSEHLHSLIDTFKPSPTKYRDIVLAKMSGEHLADLEKAIEQTKPNLVLRIKTICLDHGINPQHDKINHFIECIQDLDLSWEANSIMSALAELFHPNKNLNKPLIVVKNWIKDYVELDNDSHEKRIIAFAKANRVSDLLTKYHAVLSTWNQEMITREQLNNLNCYLRRYETACLTQSSLQIASEELESEMDRFIIAQNVFAKDAQCDWIENFFIQWSMAKALNTNNIMDQLYENLHSPLMLSKYLVNNAFLERQFPQGITTIDITPYLINRLFLHAIIVHPKQWTGLFFTYFSEVYAFVLDELTNEENHQGTVLKRDSYPEELLSQLKYVQEYYQFCQEEDAVKPKNCTTFIPMKDFILCMNDFKFISRRQEFFARYDFIMSLGIECLQNIIQTHDDLSYILRYIQENKRTVFIEQLSFAFLKGLIKDRYNFVEIIRLFSPMKGVDFINSLDDNILKEIFKTHIDMTYVIGNLSGIAKEAFIKGLNHELLQGLVRDNYSLQQIFINLTDTRKVLFINSLSNEFLKGLIKIVYDLEKITEMLQGAQKITFLSSLDNEFLKNTAQSVYGLIDIIKLLDDSQKTDFIKSWDNEFLKNTIVQSNHLPILIPILPDNQQLNFVNALSNEDLKSLIKNPYDIELVVKCFPETRKADFKCSLSNEFLKTLVNSSWDLERLVKSLPKTRRADFIGTLNDEFLKTFVKTPVDFQGLVNILPETRKAGFIDYFIKKLNEEFLINLKQCHHFQALILCLSDKQIAVFISQLKIETLLNCIQDKFEFEKVTENLSADQKKVFLESLDKLDASWLQTITREEPPKFHLMNNWIKCTMSNSNRWRPSRPLQPIQTSFVEVPQYLARVEDDILQRAQSIGGMISTEDLSGNLSFNSIINNHSFFSSANDTQNSNATNHSNLTLSYNEFDDVD